jgi:hypothetical protein
MLGTRPGQAVSVVIAAAIVGLCFLGLGIASENTLDVVLGPLIFLGSAWISSVGTRFLWRTSRRGSQPAKGSPGDLADWAPRLHEWTASVTTQEINEGAPD